MKLTTLRNILFLALLCCFTAANATYQPHFSTAGFFALEGTGRTAYSMNIAWRFVKKDATNAESISFDDSKWQVVSLPHGLEYLPVDASGGVNYQGPAWYRKHFTPDDALKGKKVFLHFEAIMGKCKVWVNGQLVATHFGGYLPVIADISNHLKWGEDNVIAVRADNSNDPLYLPGKPQNLLDFCYFGGIYRDSWLVVHNNVFITDPNYENQVAGGGLFVSYDKVSEASAIVNLKLHVRNEQGADFKGTVNYELLQSDGTIIKSLSDKIALRSGNATNAISQFELKSPNLWSPESPYLYQLNVRVKDANGKVVDGYMQRIGIRSIEFKQKDGLWLNGKPYKDKLIGTNRHQDFAVVGNALSNSTHWKDAKKLRDAGMRVIRCHYPQDPAFMDACDELGLFCLGSTAGWQFWNNDSLFSKRVYEDIRNLVRQNRNHASLFFWEPVLNETSYPASFAKNAKTAVDEEYPYPYCTSSCDDGADGAEYYPLLLRPRKDLNPAKTYFIREWGDNVDDWSAQNSDSRVNRGWGEVPMLLQAKHYGRPDYDFLCLDDIYKDSRQIVGGCFWHSFDCQRGYHPVPFLGGFMDAFRQPKYSYYMFQSQRPAQKSNLIAETGPMVFIANAMTPFSPKDVTVYSNCDEVRLTFLKGGEQKVYKKDLKRGGIPSPIVTFSNVFDFMKCKALARAKKQGEVFLLAEGLIDGKVVATHKVAPAQVTDKLVLWLDNEGVDLVANGADFVTVVAGIADKNGTIQRLSNDIVKFEIEGEGRIMGGAGQGLNPHQLQWGTAPMLVQSTTTPGTIKVTARVAFGGEQRPISGELVINSIENKIPSIFNKKEIEALQLITSVTEEEHLHNKSDLEKENERLRQELNQLKVKEVEKQQTKFGTGIN